MSTTVETWCFFTPSPAGNFRRQAIGFTAFRRVPRLDLQAVSLLNRPRTPARESSSFSFAPFAPFVVQTVLLHSVTFMRTNLPSLSSKSPSAKNFLFSRQPPQLQKIQHPLRATPARRIMTPRPMLKHLATPKRWVDPVVK
jgi:hypothetical protein